jgi:hypothetical protein
MVGHAIVNTSKVFVVLRKRSLSVFWTTNQFERPSAELLGPLRMFFFDGGSLLEEDGKILTIVSPSMASRPRRASLTLAELMLCFSLFSKVDTPI